MEQKDKSMNNVSEPDIDAIADGLRPLLTAASKAQWQVGDYLVASGPLAVGHFQRLAGKVKGCGESAGSLQAYYNVALTFPLSRRGGLAWGVYKHLARVPDETWQDKFLADHPQATGGEAERAVNAKQVVSRGKRSPRNKTSDRAIALDVTADLSVFSDNGTFTLELLGVTDAEMALVGGKWIITGQV